VPVSIDARGEVVFAAAEPDERGHRRARRENASKRVFGPEHRVGPVSRVAPQVDHHLAIDVDGGRALTSALHSSSAANRSRRGESGVLRDVRRRRVIAHQVSVQKSGMKPTPMWAGDF
jgi:hypothetical protein